MDGRGEDKEEGEGGGAEELRHKAKVISKEKTEKKNHTKENKLKNKKTKTKKPQRLKCQAAKRVKQCFQWEHLTGFVYFLILLQMTLTSSKEEFEIIGKQLEFLFLS